ncbi:Isopentenyldiphosphate isomerase [Nadsonia fulvescens var. elongata DSM 6958]|uniref:Isopentenyl-diphosphate Delta-isomerase n=1 Tax=Nadsonia fulvescens var. elongata DSM 6958 TaxID=857566 RepID=A0A1E3PF86_9ASCO|nr:Isopentenyldiphosphate isomerase [Nadsonia fulvescens var. elongata DSM 6958]
MSSTSTITYSDIIQQVTEDNVVERFPEVVTLAHDSAPTSASSASEDKDLFRGHDEEQIKLMDEMCIVLDWNDKPIGGASKKACHLMTNIDQGLLHRAFSVFLFNDEGKLLLQQRAEEKITFANQWTNTCCSHPLAIPTELGHDLESSIVGAKRAARRKLDQELGIKPEYVPIEDFKYLTRIHYASPSNGPWGEHEIDYILIIKANPVIVPNYNEVKDIKYVNADELKAMFKNPELSFTPWFKLICETYLFKWWDNLSNLDSFVEEDITRMLQ